MARFWTHHPAAVGETYAEHCLAAMGIAGRLLWIAAAAVLHAVVPALCEHTAGDALDRLSAKVAARRQRGIARIDPERPGVSL